VLRARSTTAPGDRAHPEAPAGCVGHPPRDIRGHGVDVELVERAEVVGEPPITPFYASAGAL
jgi:hypothetical protein